MGILWATLTAMLNTELLAQELAQALPGGLSLKSLTEMPTLVALEIVRAKAVSSDPEDLAAAALGILGEACVQVDGTQHGALATLLAVTPSTRGTGISERRRQAAEILHISADRVRKDREEKLVARLADELVVLDRTFQLRRKQREDAPSAPESRLNINWLERHEAYRRIWSPVSGLKNDLLVLLGYLRHNRDAGVGLTEANIDSPVPWPDLADRAMNLMWQRAKFTQAVDDFIADFGGLWLMSDPQQESKAAEAIYQIDFNGPCGEADDSWLRLQLKSSAHGELDDFIDVVYADPRGKDMQEVFLRWSDACRCSPDEGVSPKPSCSVHAWLAACQQYIRLIDEDWDKVADWYRSQRRQ